MSEERRPGGLAVWLGLADNPFTRQKTVRFGDASALRSGRVWSILVVVGAAAGSGGSPRRFDWIEPFFWPPIGATWDRLVQAGDRGVPQRAAVAACLDQRVPGADGGVARGAGRHPARLRHGAVVGGARDLRPDRRVHAADPAAGADPADHPLVRHRRDGEDLPAVPRRAVHHDDRGAGRGGERRGAEGACGLQPRGLEAAGADAT